tara:strand:+ start:527 stop:1528 length:1002 start_codon:yes stop_codon:yes gene_type:complete
MKIFKVGGAVRDAQMGLRPKDTDWVVVGSSPEEMIKKGFKQVGKDFPVFLHPNTNEEYALARKDRKTGVGHKDFQFNFSPDVTLEEDLERRDLTINSMALDENGNLIDPFNGAKDIENKCFRPVSQAFFEDPLRALRVARFKAQFPEFFLHESMEQALFKISASNELLNLSSERVWGEVVKGLEHDFHQFLQIVRNYKLHEPWFNKLSEIPDINSDIAEIKWCEVSQANEFEFAMCLDIPKSYSKQLSLWKKFFNYDKSGDVSYKVKFFEDFSKNNLPDAIFTLQFFKDINLECIPIIKEYANLNFGALSSNKKQDVKIVKEQELKKIIEKYV